MEINDLGNAVANTVDDAAASVHYAIDKASDAARPAVHQLMHAQSQLNRGVRRYVHEKPITSLGIAVASGFLLGWVLRKR